MAQQQAQPTLILPSARGVCGLPGRLPNAPRCACEPRVPLGVVWLLALVIVLAGCGGEATPEERIRELIVQAESAAEARDTGDVMAFIGEDYRDERGHTREDLRNFLRAMFLRYQSIHLLVRVSSIEINGERARVELFVAMAGHPLSETDLRLPRANVHRLDLKLGMRDGDWRVVGATWRQATREDLFGPSAASAR